jgi:regulator of RNase E activity RraA
MPQILAQLVSRLRQFDTPTISDACEAAGQECRIVTGLAPLTTSGGIAGAVITVQLAPIGESQGPSAQHLGTSAVQSATSDHVIVIDHQGRNDCAGWGGNLSRGAQRNGCAGTLIDGAARDIAEAREVGYPVFARSATPLTARGRAIEVSCQSPIQFAGCRVDPGDFLIADATGIVIVAQHAIGDVLNAASSIANTERDNARRIAGGAPMTEVMGRNYEQLLSDG